MAYPIAAPGSYPGPTASSVPPVGYPGPYDVYVANTAASGALLVGYSRNAKTFALNRYSQTFPAKNMLGLFYEYTSQSAARVVSQTAADDEWPDGDPCPPGLNNLESWTTKSFRTKRRVYPFTLGELTTEQMDFDLLLTNSNDMAQRAMTVRTMLTQNNLSAAFTGSTSSAAVNNGILPNGQGWDTGSVGYGGAAGPNVFTSIQFGLINIHMLTVGSVREDQVCWVINPQTAQAVSRSTEVQDYLKQSTVALSQIKGNVPSQNGRWGLPDVFHNVDVEVEDAVIITTNKEAATTLYGYVMPYTVSYLIAKPAALVGLAGQRSFSTIQIFFYRDEMTSEVMFDRNNKRYLSRIISNYVPVIATLKSGFQFTSLWSVPNQLPLL